MQLITGIEISLDICRVGRGEILGQIFWLKKKLPNKKQIFTLAVFCIFYLPAPIKNRISKNQKKIKNKQKNKK